MSKRLEFILYRPKTILNKAKRADLWFWTRYSAYPYIGCQHGCDFCYCRERKYSPYPDPHDFAYRIRVKENAPELLRRALHHTPIDLIFTGDYQPAERKFELSRKMLAIILEFGFPVFILERSPLVLRDLDLIQEIHKNARAIVAFSIISTPDSPSYSRVKSLERLAPKIEKRFQAMEKFAKAGVPTGTCFMPILPGLCDNPENLEAVVRWTANHGGQFVLASSLTLADQQKDYFLTILREHFPDLLQQYHKLFPPGSYSPANYDWRQVAQQIRQNCLSEGIRDRIPRPIIPGDRRAVNRRVVELLADQIHIMELTNQVPSKIWAYRTAAWTIEDLDQDLSLILSSMGKHGLESIPAIGPKMAGVIEEMILKSRLSPPELSAIP